MTLLGTDGGWTPIGRVRELIERGSDFTARLDDGGPEEVSQDAVEEAFGTIVPAQPGWQVCELSTDLADYWLTPIVAWRISPLTGVADPITIDLPAEGKRLLVDPDGLVFDKDSVSWLSIEKALAALRAEREEGGS
jgi:hypothetical protein